MGDVRHQCVLVSQLANTVKGNILDYVRRATEEAPGWCRQERVSGEMAHNSAYTVLSAFCPCDPRKGSDHPRRQGQTSLSFHRPWDGLMQRPHQMNKTKNERDDSGLPSLPDRLTRSGLRSPERGLADGDATLQSDHKPQRGLRVFFFPYVPAHS